MTKPKTLTEMVEEVTTKNYSTDSIDKIILSRDEIIETAIGLASGQEATSTKLWIKLAETYVADLMRKRFTIRIN